MKETSPYLNRYTSLPAVIDMLVEKRITLLNPMTWEDSNDAYYIVRYRRKLKLRAVLAICFSERRETFHQWRVFASGISGICVEFNKNRLLQSIKGRRGFNSRRVEYLWISQNRNPEISRWPFLKRIQFKDEKEFRIIYRSASKELQYKRVHFDLSCINRITLSPWLPESLTDSVVHTILGIQDCGDLKVNRSSLLDNSVWRKAVD